MFRKGMRGLFFSIFESLARHCDEQREERGEVPFMDDKSRGVYYKFNVTRTDGSSEPGGKHEKCFYFVLDCDHDQHAKAALMAYEDSCRLEYPALAEGLSHIVGTRSFGK
jgi:hypothetical protein